MDIIMPGMGGLETRKKIRQQWPDSRIPVVSSMVYEDIINLVYEVGGKGVVLKPLQRDALLAAMWKAMAG